MNDSDPVRIKILVVDDRPENLLALQAALKDPAYEIIRASSGVDAIEAAKKHDFALILLDVQMPLMDGFETARLIRIQKGSELTPIIFVTAIYDTKTYQLQGYSSGAVDYLYKPIDIEILKAKVNIFAELYRQKNEIRRQSELVRERDEFLSIASHVLKTPMTPLTLQMQSFIKLYEENRIEEVPHEKLIKMLRNSYGQVKQLSNLIDQLLDVTRISFGRVDLFREESDLTGLVRHVLDSLSEDASNVRSTITIDAPASAVGMWDEARLRQVIVNLISNALQYGQGKPIHIAIASQDNKVFLSVKDHGIGIQKKDQERIFSRFERGVSARSFGGLGLGLYIASQIVKLHDGTISVTSEPGEGAEFRVSLPLRPISTLNSAS